MMIKEILEQSIYEYKEKLIDENKNEDLKILGDCNIALIYSDLIRRFKVLLRYTREWKLLRGVYNNNFNYILNKKEYKTLDHFV